MSYIKAQSEEIIFIESDDRHIFIKKEHDEIVGLNYCQGGSLECFIANYMVIDHDLTDFYTAIKNNFNDYGQISFINDAIYAHSEYNDLCDARKAL